MNATGADDVAYFWSAMSPLPTGWQEELAGGVATVPDVALDVSRGDETVLRLVAATGEAVVFRFARDRGGGAVPLSAGARLVLVSLRVAIQLQLALSDARGEALHPRDVRAWLPRIALRESVPEIEGLAEAVGVLPRRVRLGDLCAAIQHRRQGGAFFA